MLMNYTFEGTATDLIEVDAEGNVTQLPATEITFENGYELQRQAGRYYTLKFCEDVMLSSEDNYKVIDTHINCQTYFINGGITNNNPVGMIVEGSWWENEAKKAFSDLESGGYERHNYRVMPICVGIGEACGIAAALAVKKGVTPREITAAEIQAELI